MFNIGDRVKIINDDEYSITTRGSTGIILRIDGNDIQIRFDFIANGYYSEYVGTTFSIGRNHIVLFEPVDKKKAVLDKIKLMENRYVSRHRSRQPVEGCEADLVYSGEGEGELLGVSSPPLATIEVEYLFQDFPEYR